MERYPGIIRYLVIYLVAVCATADGHMLCAPCLASDTSHHAGHDCELPEKCKHLLNTGRNVTPSVHSALHSDTCCLSNFDNGKLFCPGNDLPAIVVRCASNELAKVLDKSLADCGIPATQACAPNPMIGRYATTFYSPSPSLRLHLLYGVLLN